MSDRQSVIQHNRGVFIALLVLLAWLPLPLGSNRAWAWAIMEAGAFGILAIWLLNFIKSPCKLPPAVQASVVPLVILIVWLVYIFLQAIPLPSGILKALSPAAYDLYDYAGGMDTRNAPITIDRGATMAEFLKYASYVAIFFLVMAVVDSRSRLKQLATVLVFVGLVESIYGLLMTLTGIDYIWWNKKYAYHGYVTGTFINRNHFAGHLEIIIPLCLGLFLSEKERFKYYPDFVSRVKGISLYLLEGSGRRVIYLFIMFAALFLSGSRGGNACLLIALTVVAMIAYSAKGKKSREARYAPYIIAMAILAGLWLGTGDLSKRYGQSQDSATERVAAWSKSNNIISNHPVFGSGAGTFKYLFSLYEGGAFRAYYDHAHNDYLEVLAEQGVVGFALISIALFLILLKILLAYVKRKNSFMSGMLFSSLVGSVSLLLHAIVDFNFQIPANAAYFFTALGIGMAAGSIKNQKHKSSSRVV